MSVVFITCVRGKSPRLHRARQRPSSLLCEAMSRRPKMLCEAMAVVTTLRGNGLRLHCAGQWRSSSSLACKVSSLSYISSIFAWLSGCIDLTFRDWMNSWSGNCALSSGGLFERTVNGFCKIGLHITSGEDKQRELSLMDLCYDWKYKYRKKLTPTCDYNLHCDEYLMSKSWINSF